MYDYVYLATYEPETMQHLATHPGLSFVSDINMDTGEIRTVGTRKLIKREAKDHGLKFILYSNGRIEIKGSLHKFYNSVTQGEEANYNLFTYSDAVRAIELLNQMYGIIPSKTTVHNIETGLNVILHNAYTNDVLDYFVAFKNKAFSKMNIKDCPAGKGLEVYFSQYGIKVYNKGAMYAQSNEVLRFEVKYIKMQSFDGGLSLVDLTNIDVWTNLSKRLESALYDVVFTDKFNTKELTKPEAKLFQFCDNPKNWERVDKKKRYKAKEQFITLINSKGLYKFRDFFTEQFRTIIDQMLDKKRDFFTELQNSEKGLFYPLSSRSISPLCSFEALKSKYSFYFDKYTDRFCSLTGLPLVHYSKRSKNMNPKTLAYLDENCKDLYELLRVQYKGSFMGFTSKERTEYEYIAKQIRNSLSNPKPYRDNAPRLNPGGQLNMF